MKTNGGLTRPGNPKLINRAAIRLRAGDVCMPQRPYAWCVSAPERTGAD